MSDGPVVQIEDPHANLGRRAARGAATTLGAQGARILVQAGTLVVLSHLLSPEDFGLVAAVTAFTGIADLVRDFGLSSAAMQAKVLTDGQRNNLFWLNTMTGVLAGALAVSCAVPIADLYGNDRIAAITRALALVFVLDGLGTQFRAELNRRLRFGSVAIADVGAQTVAGAVAIGVAATAPGTAALVLLPIVQALTALLVLVGMLRWRPGLPTRGTNMRPLLSFGISLLAVQVLTYASRNADNVTVGRRFGPAALGIYSRAFQFLELPLNQLSAPLTTVALPVLARLQDDKVRLMAFVRRGQNLLMQVTLALLTVAASQAAVLIPVVLGNQWRASVPIFQVLAIGGAFQTAGYATYWLFLATGSTRANLRYALVIRPMSIIAIVIGSIWGVTGVAWGFAIGLVAAWPVGLWWVGRATQLPAGSLFWPCLRTITCYACAGTAAWRLPGVFGGSRAQQLLVGVLVLILVVAAAAWLVPPFRSDLADLHAAVELLSGKPSPMRRTERRPAGHRRTRASSGSAPVPAQQTSRSDPPQETRGSASAAADPTPTTPLRGAGR